MKEKLKKSKILFCGGHHTSSLPLIDSLVDDGNFDLVFVGRKRAFKDDKNDSLEYIDIKKRNIKFYDLKTSKFYGKSLLSIFKIFIGFLHSFKILIKEKPDLVISFGGYIAVPIVIASFILRIKIITHEQTVVTGIGNKIISYFCDRILITWPESIKYFDEKKTKIIGLPLRQSLFSKPKKINNLNSTLPTIYITCGKTGSHIINEFVLNNLEELLNNFNIIHQSGDYSVTNDFQNLTDVYQNLKNKVRGTYILAKFMFDEEVLNSYYSCDLVVSRSGAHTIYEILFFKKKSILIPIPWVSHNEQFLNAEIVRDAGLGLILEEKNLTYNNFLTYTTKILKFDKFKNDEIDSIIKLNSKELFLNEIKIQLQK